uniref:Enoyl reductase (ER) domain-containing protein n=1 Tax=Lactuca sativa TaxID=4236 RepID=A0A9R1WRB1_LACSA|nr:hypothetical protein LSAT_V11C100035900 [Lactuca sativa]
MPTKRWPINTDGTVEITSTNQSTYPTKPNHNTKTMVKAITVHKHGGTEVLKWEDIKVQVPKEGEIRLKQKAIGLNFLDVYMRQGLHNRAPPLPYIPGMEGAGIIIVVGPGVTSCKVGDVVVYAGLQVGSFAQERILRADQVVPVASSVDPVDAAAVIFKGLTAHVLLHKGFKVERGHTILVHAAASGVGYLLCQWGSAIGAIVIRTVSTKQKALQAKEDGCHHVILLKYENFVDHVMEITSGKMVELVYDSVGKDTFDVRINSLLSRKKETVRSIDKSGQHDRYRGRRRSSSDGKGGLKSVGFEDVVGRLKAYDERIREVDAGEEQSRVLFAEKSTGDGGGSSDGGGNSSGTKGNWKESNRSNKANGFNGTDGSSGSGSGGSYGSGGPKGNNRKRGYMVLFGMASGEPQPLSVTQLASKSFYYTFSSVGEYTEDNREELLVAAKELFDNVAKGVLRVRVNHKYLLSQASQAHIAIERRKTTGSVVLIPGEE